MVTTKKYMSLLSILLLCSSLDLKAQEYTQAQLVGLAATLTAAAAATAGAIWYACQPYSAEELERKTEEIDVKMDVLASRFNFPTINSDLGMSMSDDADVLGTKKAAPYWNVSLPLLDEYALRKYIGISGIVDGTLHVALTQVIDEISYLESKFPKTIQRERNAEIKLCLQEHLTDLERIRYACLFLDKLFTCHKPYFELRDLIKQVSLQYAQELRALTYSYEHVRSLYSFKRVNQLARDFNRLRMLLSDEKTRRYPTLRSEAECLLYDLTSIYNHMKSNPCYALDLYNEQLAEALRVERLRNQMLQNQLYSSYQEPTTHVHVGIEYTIDTTSTKTTAQEVAPVETTPVTTSTSVPANETKSEKPATLDSSSTSIFDPKYSHGAADL